MGLKEILAQMKLVELDEAAASGGAAEVPDVAPVAMPRTGGAATKGQPMSVQDLLASLPAKPAIDESKLPKGKPASGRPEPPPSASAVTAAPGPPQAAPNEGGEIPDFESIYQAAGITAPAHGFTSYKVLEILSAPDFEALEGRAKAAALAAFLRMNPTGPVPITDIVEDAVRRDQALDSFEEFLRKKLEEKRAEVDRKNAELQAEIDSVTARNKEQMDAHRRTLDADRDRLGSWQARKRIEERRLFDAVSPFVEKNPVTAEPKS